MNVLQVVILPAPSLDKSCPASEQVAQQKSAALHALCSTAAEQDFDLGQMPLGESDQPTAPEGYFSAVAYSQDFVAGSTAPWPLGIDIERVRRVSPEAQIEAASSAELALVARLFGETKEEAFARILSAKHAFLKLAGKSLDSLAHTLVAPNSNLEQRPGIWIRCGNKQLFVHQERRGAHFVSLACDPINAVTWNWTAAPTPIPARRTKS